MAETNFSDLDANQLQAWSRDFWKAVLKSLWPAAGGLEFGVWARRRQARFLRLLKSLWPAAGGLDF